MRNLARWLLPATLMAATLVTSAGKASGQTETYPTFKRAFQAMFDKGEITVHVVREGGAVDLMDCSYGALYLGAGVSDRAVALANLAYEVVRLKALMARLGYPENVWRPYLLELERRPEGLSPGGGEHLEPLSTALNRYRQSAPELPRVRIEGGCGEGEVGIRIATQPRGGRVHLIPIFFYRLCEVQKIDPDDVRRCDHWREPVEGALLDVAGDYFYQASWPGGGRSQGKLSFTNLEYGQTVTIRKP
jgi:hypothetical protein